MTTLGIRYLRGYAVAEDRAMERFEWPLHPGRVFMAMAAVYFETGQHPDERLVLEWLENQRAPRIAASNIQPRARVEAYVPVNDNAAAILDRSRQPRTFSTARLDRNSVFLTWDESIPAELADALDRLCRKVTRIGHSSSLVQMWLAPEPAEAPSWTPSEEQVDHRLRIPVRGTLAYLERTFGRERFESYDGLAAAIETAKGKQKAQLKAKMAEAFPDGAPKLLRPRLSTWQGYSKIASGPAPAPPDPSPFDPRLIIFRRDEGNALTLESTLALTGALRDLAMKMAGQNVPEWLSGHRPDGSVIQKPHAAFFPLPFVDFPYADGHIVGLAIAIPREVPEGERRKALGPLLFGEGGDETQVHLWRGGAWHFWVCREARTNPPVSLRAKTWIGSARTWASVTPVVLHHYPKKNRDADVERILLEAFDSALLPRPKALRVQPASHFTGALGSGTCLVSAKAAKISAAIKCTWLPSLIVSSKGRFSSGGDGIAATDCFGRYGSTRDEPAQRRTL